MRLELSAVSLVEGFGALLFKRQSSQSHCDLPIDAVAFFLGGQSGRNFEKPLSKGREEIIDVGAWSPS
jgi:hypothetical protein